MVLVRPALVELMEVVENPDAPRRSAGLDGMEKILRESQEWIDVHSDLTNRMASACDQLDQLLAAFSAAKKKNKAPSKKDVKSFKTRWPQFVDLSGRFHDNHRVVAAIADGWDNRQFPPEVRKGFRDRYNRARARHAEVEEIRRSANGVDERRKALERAGRTAAADMGL